MTLPISSYMLRDMPRHDQQSATLSIERHAVQYILHASLDGSGNACTGVIGCRHNGIISHAVVVSDMQPDALITACNNWQQQGISPCGTFSASDESDTPDLEEVAELHTLLRQTCRHSSTGEALHLLVSLNTKGCLETQAFRLEEGQVVTIPLVLLEDGQTG